MCVTEYTGIPHQKIKYYVKSAPYHLGGCLFIGLESETLKADYSHGNG